MNKELKQYEKACEALKDKFLADLYKDEDYMPDDAYWIGDEVGGVLFWGDWFVDMDNMANYYRYSYTPDEFFDWHDQLCEDKKGRRSMRYYKAFKGTKHKKLEKLLNE